MKKSLKIGMIGLDTSHVSAFAALLNNPDHSYHVPGGKIEVAYPGVPSADFELSYSRVEQFTDELRNKYGVSIVDSAEAVAEQSDALFIESVDGRVHLEMFRKVAPFGKPVYIDKPLTVSAGEAKELFALAAKHGVPVMSSSALRYAQALNDELEKETDDVIIGADCYGPMPLQPTQPGFFWYGIHTVEILYRILGKGCTSLSVTTNDDHDVIVGTWQDGRIGTIRGNRKGSHRYGALIHRQKGTSYVDISAHPRPAYSGLLERIIPMFATGKADIDPEETLEIIRFIECANESRGTGKTVRLS